jgi:hypothetical protein
MTIRNANDDDDDTNRIAPITATIGPCPECDALLTADLDSCPSDDCPVEIADLVGYK